MKAYFIRTPRTARDLFRPHLAEHEREFQIVKVVGLEPIDYENFVTDMLADRQFIEDAAALCGEGEIMKCLFAHRYGRSDGILIVPESDAFVKWAAYIKESAKCE